MKLLFQLASPARGLLFRAALWSTLSGVGGAWLVALINETLQADSGAMPRLGLEFAALSLGVLGLRWISQRQFVCLSQDSQARLRAIVSGRIAEAPYRQIESRGSAALVGVLTEDVSTVAQFFTTLPELLMNGAVVLGCLGYLGWLSWKVLLFAIAIVALGSLGYHLAELRALGHLRRAREEEDRLFRYFHALFDGAKELKLHRARRASFLTSSLGGSIEHSRSERTRGLLIYVGSASWGSFLFFVMIGLVLFVLAQPLGVEARALSGYALMFLYMMLPLDAALGALPGINRARVALEHIDRVISELPPQREGWEPVRGSEAQRFRQLALRGVTHRYQTEDGGFVLGPLDLAIEPGEVVFVIGGNGSGKSTLAKLLVGLYTPDSGEIVLNGQRVLERDLEGYRQHFSAIFSDFYLFENLVGLAAADLEQRGRELLRSLALERKVDLVGDRFSTLALSQGQRKRLALLVSYLEDRAVYLFDEWAADQDPEYREVFYRRLLPELRARGKAVVVITHDDRYFGLADRCIKLEAGKIVSSLQPHGLESAQSARALTAS